MDFCVFIQANEKQMLGAIVVEFVPRRYSRHNDCFNVCIVSYDNIPVFQQHEGRAFCVSGVSGV